MTKNFIFSSLFSLFLITLDQLSKAIISGSKFNFGCNSNFGLGLNLTLFKSDLIFIFIPAAVLAVIFNLLWKTNGLIFFGLILIFSGGVSNLIERIYRGCVVDFISFGFFPVTILTTAFNFADAFIFFGVLILVYKTLIRHE